MTRKDELVKMAERLAFEAGHFPRLGQNESPQALVFQAGFTAAVELLLPVVEAIDGIELGDILDEVFDALNALDAKLADVRGAE